MCAYVLSRRQTRPPGEGDRRKGEETHANGMYSRSLYEYKNAYMW